MPRSKTGALIIGALALLVSCGGKGPDLLPPGDYDLSFDYRGTDRCYLLHIPESYAGNVNVPLVVDLHGDGHSNESQKAISGFLQQSDENGFLVAFPAALDGVWEPRENEDVGFLRTLVTAVSRKARVDADRVYATGWSSVMTNALACRAADLFTAFAPFAYPLTDEDCRPRRPAALIQFAGLTDQVIPYEGDDQFPSAPKSFDGWRALNDCDPERVEERIELGGSFCDFDRSCASEVEVALCSIRGVETPPLDGHLLYENVDQIDLAKLAWEFLSRFTFPER
jgi:polyhydroxybutyrate depolymerase